MDEPEALREPELFTVDFTARRDEVEAGKPPMNADRRSSLSQRSVSLPGRHRPLASPQPFMSNQAEETNLVGAVHEMNGDAEGQRVVVRVPQQNGDDLHTRRSGLPLAVPERPLHRPLAVHGVLAHLAPEGTGVEEEWVWHIGDEVFLAAHLGSALRCRYCFRYHRKCC